MGLFPEPQRRGLEGCLLLLANFKAGEASRRQYRRRPLLQSLPRQARIWRAELKEYGAAGNGGSYPSKTPFFQHSCGYELLLNMPLQDLDQKLSQVRSLRFRPRN